MAQSVRGNRDAQTGNKAKTNGRIRRAVQSVLESLEPRQLYAVSPLTIQAENFDQGGEGVAYHDTDTINRGGAYRTSEGVDVETNTSDGGGYDVGWVKAGEWLQYTVNVAESGTYHLDFRMASPGTAGKFHVNVDGVNVTGTVTAPSTGSWLTWTTVSSKPFNLTAGQHVFRVAFDTNGSTGNIADFNWLRLTQDASSTVTAPAAPSNLTATASSTSAIALSWTDNASNESGYYVERSADGTSFSQIASLGAGATSYSNSGLAAATRYYYRVRAYNSAGASAYSAVANATTQAAPTTGTATLVSVSQAAVDKAIAKSLLRYSRSVTNGAFTADAWGGGASLVLAEAAYAGNATADARLLQQMRYTIAGGNEIIANGGYPAQYELWVTGMYVMAKQTPRIWNQLTSAEKAKVDLVMKAALVSSAFVTSDSNPYIAAGTTQYALDGDSNLARDWNPNYRQGMLGGVLTGTSYFGTAQAQNILATYDHQAFVSQLQAAGLTNLYQTFNWKAANSSSAAPSGSTIQSTVRNYHYYGMAVTNPVGIYTNLMMDTYSKYVNSGLNGGAGINGAGKIVSGADTLPNKGQLGMLKEFDSMDAGGPRSSAGYSYFGFQWSQANTLALITSGLWDASSAAMQDLIKRMNVGGTDMFYKLDKGYYDYAKGSAQGTTSINDTGFNYAFTRPMWENVIKAYINNSGSTPTVPAPAAPSGLTAAASSSSAVTLNWVDNATNETGYQLERKTGSSGTYQLIATLAAGSTTYSDSGLTASTQYYYRVRAMNGTTASAYSNEATATTAAAPAPVTPTWTTMSFPAQTGQFTAEFDATPQMANMDVVMGLSNGAATSFTSLAAVARFNSNGTIDARNGGSYAAAASLAYSAGTKYHFKFVANVATHTYDLFVTAGTTTTQIARGYAFRTEQATVSQLSALSSYNTTGSATLAGLVVATSAPVVTAPAAPSNLTATASSTSAIALSWTDNASNESGYYVERSADGTSFSQIASLGAGATSYSNSGLAAATRYYYRVRAYNSAGASAYSAVANATTQAASTGTPTSLVLTPGSGFPGATAQPATAGSSTQLGYTERAIARWDVVPDQTFSGTMNVGVVAFHMAGIDRVSFSVNGGAWQNVTQMTMNPETGVSEYWATLDAAKFANDGRIEVRAVAYPKVGVARVLESLFLNVNGKGTLASPVRYVSTTGNDANDGLTPQTAKKDIAGAIWSICDTNGDGTADRTADGATIYLLAGNHTYTPPSSTMSAMANSQRWLTIAAAPGLSQSQVHLKASVSNARIGNLKRVRLNGLTVDAVTGGPVVLSSLADARVWWDRTVVDGVDRYAGTASAALSPTSFWTGGKYITDSVVRNLVDGATNFAIVRNVAVEHIVADGFSGSSMVLNSTVRDINPGTTGAHPDVYQLFTSKSNVILYGLTTPYWNEQDRSQGICLQAPSTDLPAYTDFAIVNVKVSAGGGVGANLGLGGNLRNIYIAGSDFRGASRWDQKSGYYQATSLVFDDTVFRDYSTGSLIQGPAYPGALYI